VGGPHILKIQGGGEDAGKLVTGDKQRVDMLNTYFSSVCKNDNGDLPNIEKRVDNNVRLEFVHFDQAAVMKAMKKLKPNEASGPDGLPPQLFKRVGCCLAEPLSVMFSSFFSVHQVPNVWSKAAVTPIFKGGDSCNASNYRPISLTCVAYKLMERIIAVQMLDYLRVNSLISKQQHGFLCFVSKDPPTLMKAFLVYVRPVLEYASCVWCITRLVVY